MAVASPNRSRLNRAAAGPYADSEGTPDTTSHGAPLMLAAPARRGTPSRDRHSGGHEGQLVASGDVEEPAAEKGADGTAEAAARLDHPEDRAKLWPREDVGRNRRELRDAHAEAKPRRRIEEKEGQIVRASRQGETANSDQGDNRAERKYPPAAHIIREPATEEVSRRRVEDAKPGGLDVGRH